MSHELSRRHALTGAATIGLGLPLLSACGDDATGAGSDPTPSPSAPSSASPTASPSATESSSKAKPATGIVATTEVPVGSGIVVSDSQVVITQPTQGEFKAFSVTCTHAGCPVNEVTETINCPCHGSTFSITDGSPTGGPAPSPLDEVAISVVGDQISLA